MDIVIIKNGGTIVARTKDYEEGATYTLVQTILPEYPSESAGFGKNWELVYDGETFAWDAIDRPLTMEEQLQDAVNGLNILGVNGE